MKLSEVLLCAAVALFILLSGCGGGSTPVNIVTPPPAPTPSDAWFGTAGNVLVSDRGHDKDGKIDFLWIGFNSQTEWQKFLSQPPNSFMMGGMVMSPAGNGVNFFFDPSTATTAQASVPEEITLLDNLKADPTQLNMFDQTHRWLIQVTVEQIK